MSTPEQQARETIDALLSAAGWAIQDIASLNLHAARGVAVREMQSHGGPADYVLFVDGKALGIVEAKKEGTTLGESMNRRIPNGSWCLFREPSDGSRNGKVVLVQGRDIQDPDTGGQCTVKIYRSEKTETEDSWSHLSIRLEPDSMDFNLNHLTFEPETVNNLRVVGEFVGLNS